MWAQTVLHCKKVPLLPWLMLYYRLETNAADWVDFLLTSTMADNSEGGSIITLEEYNRIWDYPLPVNITREMAETLVKRMNDTTYSWEHGILEADGIVSYSALSNLQEQIQANEDQVAEVGWKSTVCRTGLKTCC